MTLYETLISYCSSDAYPFHMPGHKRRVAAFCDPSASFCDPSNRDPFYIDLTEIDGFDNLHHAEGILKEAQQRAAALYKSQETHFLVNGSTAGVLSAIGACTRPGDCILMARNSHRSAYNAAALNRLQTAYLYPGQYHPRQEPALIFRGHVNAAAGRMPDNPPELSANDLNGAIEPAQVEEALRRHPDARALFLTSPTYDGVVSDIAQIARIAHRQGIPLIVDEAHGAHFGMHPIFPQSAIEAGADLVIHSLHKTLPALTQCALIHVNGPLVDRARLRRLLGVYQTSSPSYVLMASIDQCIHQLTLHKKDWFEAYALRLSRFYRETNLTGFSFLHTDDPSRILISPGARSNLSAMQLHEFLRERFHLQSEMVTPSYVLMLSSVCDDDEGFARLSSALLTLDQESRRPKQGASSLSATHFHSGSQPPCNGTPSDAGWQPLHNDMLSDAGWQSLHNGMPSGAGWQPSAVCTIAGALDADAETVSFPASTGRVGAEFLTLYPPGIPLLVPGERITDNLIRNVLSLKERGYSLTGPDDHSLKTIRVMAV